MLWVRKEVRKMKAFQCDRCKRYFNEKNVDGSSYPYIMNVFKGETESRVADLCPTCKENLVKWLNVKEETNKE
jgi:hypothetical protein